MDEPIVTPVEPNEPTPETKQPTPEPEKTFTQEQVNEMIKKRVGKVEKQKQQAIDDFVTKLGYNDRSELSEFVQDAKDIRKEYQEVHTELAEIKKNQEQAAVSALFEEYKIEDESAQAKMTKLAKLETEGTFTDKLKKTLEEFSGVVVNRSVGANHKVKNTNAPAEDYFDKKYGKSRFYKGNK